MVCRPPTRDESVPVELKAGQQVTLTCNREARFSESVVPLSCASLDDVGICAGAEVFIGQCALETGRQSNLTQSAVQQPVPTICRSGLHLL